MSNTQELQATLDHWRAKFRVLAKWDIKAEDSDAYNGQVSMGKGKVKGKAVVYPVPEGVSCTEYALHEILHCAVRAAEKPGKRHTDRDREELLVQDLCEILSQVSQ